jgi:hypothetical protein
VWNGLTKDEGEFERLELIITLNTRPVFHFRLLPLNRFEFLPAFKQVLKATFTKQNIKAGFRGAGLVPYDLERVISCLDLRLRTLTLPL